MKNIAIFASGSGSNAEEITRHFQKVEGATVALILTNNPQAYVLERARKYNVPSHIFTKSELKEEVVLSVLRDYQIDFIILAGFLLLVPETLVEAYPDKILNIHPALLPKFGGKGMYGDRVHEAVIEQKEKETGITIHLVNQQYDEGQVVFQARCPVEPGDTPSTIAEKVHQLEYTHYPRVIEEVLKNK